MGLFRVLIADDEPLIRRGLRSLLSDEPDFVVVGEAGCGGEALDMARREQPHVMTVAIGLPVLSGIEVTHRLSTELPDTHIVILTARSDETNLFRALRAGARGYVLKNSGNREIVSALRAAAQNQPFFSSAVHGVLAGNYVRRAQEQPIADSYDQLTCRERQILQLMAEGQCTKEIAGILNLSPATVACHRQHVFRKLNFHSLHELILFAVRRGIVSLQGKYALNAAERSRCPAAEMEPSLCASDVAC